MRIPIIVSWVSPGIPPSGTCQRVASKGHLIQLPKPPPVGPSRFGGEADYSELLPGDWAPHPISKGAPPAPPPSVEHTFCHDLKFVSTDEGRNVDGPLNRELHLSPQRLLHLYCGHCSGLPIVPTLHPSLLNKSPRHLNSSTWGRGSSMTESHTYSKPNYRVQHIFACRTNTKTAVRKTTVEIKRGTEQLYQGDLISVCS